MPVPRAVPVTPKPEPKPKKNMTMARAFWLWFRFVLLVAGVLIAVGLLWLVGSWAFLAIVDLFNRGSVLTGLIIIGTGVSIGVGTWIYCYQRNENPKEYRR